MNKFSKEEIESFKIFAHKAPVGIEVVKRKAYRAYKKVEKYFTDFERSVLLTEASHGHMGEGRDAFDSEVKKAYTRLGVDIKAF